MSVWRMETSDDRDLYWDLGRMKSVTRLNHAPLCAPLCHARFISLSFETSIVNFSTFLVDYCPLLVYPNV